MLLKYLKPNDEECHFNVCALGFYFVAFTLRPYYKAKPVYL